MDKKQYTIAENQHVAYAFVFTGKDALWHHEKFSFILEAYASLRVEFLVVDTDANIEIECIMKGHASQAVVHGAYVINNQQKIHIATVQHHQASHTKSSFVVKGISDKSANFSYAGRIRVEKEAAQSVSSQENKNILLGDNARAVSVPCLEVLTNDVQCFHGSATGKFDKDNLLYAASRGIDEVCAVRLFTQAFFAGMFKDETVSSQLKDVL